MDNLLVFQKIYWSAFQRPGLSSKKYNDLWIDLEPISDWLAGPLYGIYIHGNCDYVFNDNDGRFPRVTSPGSFLAWENDVLKRYREEILNKKPKGFKEEADVCNSPSFMGV